MTGAPTSRRGFADHPCAVCGFVPAPFGFGASDLRGVPGIWACEAHRHEVERAWRSGAPLGQREGRAA